MSSNAEAYPLYWPESRKRTSPAFRDRSRFKIGDGLVRVALCLRNSSKSRSRTSIILSTNIPLRRDGLPYAGQKEPDDPGVAVYFRRDGKDLCFSCDKWKRVAENIYAIACTIDALRGIARWGTGDMVAAAFAGFEALPAGNSKRSWWVVLGLPDGKYPAEVVEDHYAQLARRLHPDRGGSHDAMQELNDAYEIFKKERGL